MRTSTLDTTILRYGPLKMMIEMVRVLVVALLLSSLVMPMASAHGANDFSIIMRGSSIQPGVAEVMQNDSVTFYNVADANRTIRVDWMGMANTTRGARQSHGTHRP
ncbi:MAG: hypothetical protein Ct9H90mP24_2170 [Methanobacteriota archaeon]|nr:MAG: hypothetical protein Ct9H90mP24_2170 [Euryarchaeota archaeon]